MVKLFDKLQGKDHEKDALAQELTHLRQSFQMERQRVVQSTSKASQELYITSAAMQKLMSGKTEGTDALSNQKHFLDNMFFQQMELGELTLKPDRSNEAVDYPFTMVDFNQENHELVDPSQSMMRAEMSNVLDSDCNTGDKVIILSPALYNKRDKHSKLFPSKVIKIKPGQTLNLEIDGIGLVTLDSDGNLKTNESKRSNRPS